jgi:hypothetical protein
LKAATDLIIRSLPAGAVETPVFGASPAVPQKFLAKMLSRTVQPDGEIVSCEAKIRSGLGGVLAIEINALEQFAILVRHGGQQALEALAERFFIVRIGRLGKLALELLQRVLSRCIAAVEIDDGMPQYPVKPSDGVFIADWLIRRFQRFHQTLLHHVLRKMRIADTASGEGGEDMQVLDQGFFETAHAESLERRTRPGKAATKRQIKISV